MDLVVIDASATGQEVARLLLEGVPSPITLRELIRFRVREEVARYNSNRLTRFAGLVRPTVAEATVNAYQMASPRPLDWQAQALTALTAFERNGFFVFVGDRQLEDLEDPLSLDEMDVVSFVRIVPLVGG